MQKTTVSVASEIRNRKARTTDSGNPTWNGTTISYGQMKKSRNAEENVATKPDSAKRDISWMRTH
jgi:hypothetical protein